MLFKRVMGALESSHGDNCVLEADHLIGRAPDAALRLVDASVSWRHASLRWTGLAWEAQDLGSRNGTFVDGQRLDGGARVALRLGTRLRFGSAREEWELVDTAPPLPSVVSLETGARFVAQDGLIGLPSAEQPELSIYQRSDGSWVAERSDMIWTPIEDEVLVAGAQRFRFQPGATVYATSAGPIEQPSPSNIALEFLVSRNEEHVDLTIVHRAKRIPLRPRAHTYVLLTLARLRATDQRDSNLPATSHGWVDQEQLLGMLASSPTQLAVDIYRARRQFGKAGVLNAAQVVERRATSHELRLGIANVSIDVA